VKKASAKDGAKKKKMLVGTVLRILNKIHPVSTVEKL
jgi:hypothetical protein